MQLLCSNRILGVILLACVLLVGGGGNLEGEGLKLVFNCSPGNDLYSVLSKSGCRCPRYDTAAEAIGRAEPGDGVLILADGYPDAITSVDSTLLDRAAEKRLRLFIEYPGSIPGLEIGPPQRTIWERAVVASDAFGEALPKLRILAIHDCRFVPVSAPDPLLVVARVAGFDTAIYGLPEQTFPILFDMPGRNLVIATTKLSNFVSGRYAPTEDWKTIWEHVLGRLSDTRPLEQTDSLARLRERAGVRASLASHPHPDPLPPAGEGISLPASRIRSDSGTGNQPPTITWNPTVRPALGPDQRLPRDAERRAFNAAAKWYHDSRLLIHPLREPEIHRLLKSGAEAVETPGPDEPMDDGSNGILEGYSSAIRFDGSQIQRIPIRSDCNAEAAMVLALDWATNGDTRSRDAAKNLLDYVYLTSGMHGRDRGNPKHPAFGLIAWGNIAPAWEVANYSDDDARVMLSAMVVSACLDSDRWDASILKGLLANLRTTGTLGFRGDRIDMPQIEGRGWKAYHDAQTVNYSPHHESYLWACNLWAYRQTGYKPFIERTKTAIRMTMEAYPDGWRWNDSIERARMLLCLAWLVRLEDTPEHRAWLNTVADSLIERQHPCGAIQERFTGGRHGFQIPASNDEYGTSEMPLIQQNGDPASDQLYTTGFALLGFHEAYAAVGDPKLKAAEDKLAEYLCRIQVRSDKYPYLNGAWFRAFDYNRWDYWAASGDIGWGAWSVESGWGPAWTAAVLGLRLKGTSFWDLTSGSRIIKQFRAVREQMSQNAGEAWR